MDKDFCLNTSAIWQFVGYGVLIVKIIIPIVLIIFGVVELSKCVVSGKDEDIKNVAKKLLTKIALAIAIFFIPTVTRLVFGLIKQASESMVYANGCIECMLAPRKDSCTKAVESAKEYRKTKNAELYKKYYNEFGNDWSTVVDHSGENSQGNPTENPDEPTDNPTYEPPTGDSGPFCTSQYKITEQTVEPNPLNVIACYPDKYKLSDYTNRGNLGAWPVDYPTIPKMVGRCQMGKLLFPVTGSYGTQTGSSYQHHGLDIGWSVGTPIYAPASGQATFSWGTSINKKGGESNYAVSITLSNPVKVTIDGKAFSIKSFWMGHMLGIAARGSKGVTQGELIGFRGTTFNTTHNTDAPHVHWTFKGSWEGSSALVDLTDDQIIKAFSVLNDSMGSSINAGTCF